MGRALRGKKVEGIKRGAKFRRLNVIGARCCRKHIAIKTYTHSTNSEFFEKWFTKCLLKKVPKEHTIIMDNASFHRKGELESLAKKAEVGLLFLPAYSPDFNPIEHSWANMKRWLRDNESRFPTLDSAIYHFFQCKDI